MTKNLKTPEILIFGLINYGILIRFVLIFTFITPFILNAQKSNLRFEHISLDQGLSQSIVQGIHKDKKGFMWFGTQSGLNKYDGYQFTEYKYNPFDSTSISNNQIQAIYEDSNGDLWIGTIGGGLNRFNRETEIFTHYINDPDDSTSLGHDFVTSIYEDSKQNLWVLTFAGGADRLNRETGKFSRYRHKKNDPNSLSHNIIRTGLEDKSGTIWIGTVSGLNKYNREQDNVTRYLPSKTDPNSISYDEVTFIYESPSQPGILWISTGELNTLKEGGGLNRFDTKTEKFTHYNLRSTKLKKRSGNIVRQIHEDKDGIFWICSTQGLVRFDRQKEQFDYYLPDPKNPESQSNNLISFNLFAITEDVHGDLWITTNALDGIYRFDKATYLFEHYRHDPDDPNSLSNDFVLSVYEDTTGVLWIGTNTGGLNKLDHYAKKFATFTHDPTDPTTISHNLVRSFCEDKYGNLWVGVADNGLNRFDSESQQIKHYRFNSGDPNSISNDAVFALYEDQLGDLWIGTMGGLDKFNRDDETFIHFRHNPNDPTSISSNAIRAIFEDESGVLWIGTDEGGLNRFNPKERNFTRFTHIPDDPYSLSYNIVRAIAQDSSGVLWIGTFGGGLNKLVLKSKNKEKKGKSEVFEPEKQIFTPYRHNPHDPNSLSNNSIQSIYIDDDGILWIGTFGGGLNRFDPVTEKFEHFTEHNSDLPNNVIYGVLGDDHGNIWLSSNRGISKYNPKTNIFTNYDVDDGLQSKEFNGQACYKNKYGEMFFGGINGFNIFHPDSIRDNPYEPQIAITDFKLFGQSVPIGENSPLKKHISETAEVKLAHWQNNISFEFVALHYNQPEKNRYSYILVNYDQAWHPPFSHRTATYTNLEPGEYFFRVRGSNNDGVWNKKGATVRIVITPPWWKTIWAYFLYGFSAVALFFISHRIQRVVVVRRERARSKIREAELRAQAAEAQARAIQAENERKTIELEKARRLQLSMLPKQLPNVPHLDIAVHMQTATEVGGDYYDFYLDNNGCLTVVIGDATGHGLNAGTMVSVIKGLFIANVSQADFKTFFENCTRTIKQLHLGNLYMALALIKIEAHELIASAAGMPPIYIYRNRTRTVDEIVLKGMPLGAFDDFSYQDERTKLEKGDSILLLSDGLPELFNHKKEMFDYHRVKETFEKVGHQNPEKIIDSFIDVAEQWRDGRAQDDDVTFVVLKVKEDRR
jgi:serine phosphatase RsbU (regulator of sigma subunit)/ligand-binding sensor domain-containing protein